MIGHAIHEKNLIKPDPHKAKNHVVKPVERNRRERADDIIEGQRFFDRAVKKRGEKSAVDALELVFAQDRRKLKIDIAVVFDAGIDGTFL